MKAISALLKAHLAGNLTTLAVCLRITRIDGVIVAATNHDVDIVVADNSGSPVVYITYLASAGGTDSDVQTTSALSVDNVEQRGILNLDSITDADLHAGLYDYASMSLFAVNYSDLTQGVYHLRDGFLGQVTTERDAFITELRGMMEALRRAFGNLVNPLCPYNLGDFPAPAPLRGRCRLDLGGSSSGSPSFDFTVSGTIEGVSTDGVTLYDSTRNEPGPAGGVAITSITNANPGVVTTVTDLGLLAGEAVTLSDIVGPDLLNGTTIIRNPGVGTFELGIDTSDTGVYPPYVGSGIATPAGAESGWFDYGLFTATSGLNIDRSMEVKSYVPGQWTLQLPMPYVMAIGDTYTMTAGDNKTYSTCRNKFNNALNFGGFPFVPGQDRSIQVTQPTTQQSGGKK